MNKLVVVLLLALLSCALAIRTSHEQMFGPSQPGGTYTGTNGTSSTGYTTPYSQPSPALINGQPYTYNGPFTLACWLPTNLVQPYMYNTCFSSQGCYNMLIDFQNCKGVVKKYPPVTNYPPPDGKFN